LTPQKDLAKSSLAIAHDGTVNGLLFTPDGNSLLSTGTDNRMRCWNTATGMNTLVNYPNIQNSGINSIQIAASLNGKVVYHPVKQGIHSYDIHTGELLSVMQGHFEKVRSCVFHTSAEVRLHSTSS
jgi:DNA excision repair protein ERCC-8